MSHTALKEHVYEEAFDHLATGNDLIESTLEERDVAVKLVNEILVRFEKLNTLMRRSDHSSDDESFEPLVYDLVDNICHYSDTFKQYQSKIVKTIDARYWLKIIDTTKLTAVMNTRAKQEMRTLVQKNAPAFDRKHVYGTLEQHLNNRFITFVQGAVEVFQSLNHSFKSNDQICFRDRLIFSNAMCGDSFNSYSSAPDRIQDVERIFCILDAKDPSELDLEHRASAQLRNWRQFENGIVPLPYFNCKVYKNGNVHLWFTRRDLVDKLNALIANYYGSVLGHRTAKR